MQITQYIKHEILEQIKGKKNKQTYNIVYRERTINIKTISELFGANKKSYEETLSAVK